MFYKCGDVLLEELNERTILHLVIGYEDHQIMPDLKYLKTFCSESGFLERDSIAVNSHSYKNCLKKIA